MRRVGGGGAARWAERLDRVPDDGDSAVDAALARAALDIHDSVESAEPVDAGAEAVATVGGRGRARSRAVALFRALAETEGELAPVDTEFGSFTEALVHARAQVEGDLAAVLDKYIRMRREVAGGVGSISTG